MTPNILSFFEAVMHPSAKKLLEAASHPHMSSHANLAMEGVENVVPLYTAKNATYLINKPQVSNKVKDTLRIVGEVVEGKAALESGDLNALNKSIENISRSRCKDSDVDQVGYYAACGALNFLTAKERKYTDKTQRAEALETIAKISAKNQLSDYEQTSDYREAANAFDACGLTSRADDMLKAILTISNNAVQKTGANELSAEEEQAICLRLKVQPISRDVFGTAPAIPAAKQ